MYCQSFSRLTAVFVFGVAFALSSLRGADDAALDTAAIESITGLKGSFNQSENRDGLIVYDALYRWLKFCRDEKHLWFPPTTPKPAAAG